MNPQNYTITATIKVTFECSATNQQDAESQFQKEFADAQEGTDFRLDNYEISDTVSEF